MTQLNFQTNFEIPEGYFRVCSLDDLTENKGKRYFINDTEIALFKINNDVLAVSNICPHQHSSVIYDGFVEDCYVVCPVHGWKFNLRTGKQPTGYNGLESYQVIINNKDIYVKVLKKELKW